MAESIFMVPSLTLYQVHGGGKEEMQEICNKSPFKTVFDSEAKVTDAVRNSSKCLKWETVIVFFGESHKGYQDDSVRRPN